MRYVNNKFGPLAGQRFWGARIKNQSPKRVTDYSRTRHVRVRVICIWMVWLLMMRGGESAGTAGAGYSCEGRCMGELFDCYPLVPFCGRIDRRVAGAEATSSMAPTLLLICRVSVWYCTEGKSSWGRGVERWFRYRQTCCSTAGSRGRERGTDSRARISTCPLVRFLCLCQMALSFQ